MKTTKESIKVGVVGCGYWGPNLVRNLRQSPDCQLKLICDTSEQRLAHMRRLYPEVATTRCFEDLLNGADLDAVVIATPVRSHYEMAKAGLSMGKHVLIEKPMTATLPEAEELVELAERQGLVLMVGHTFLFSPAVRRMKEIVDAGDIGEVQYISARRLNLGLFQKDINVVRGEMSLVGPRPCIPYEYELYKPWQRRRFDAVPGLTGLWQVSGKNRTTFNEMIWLDIEYSERTSLWFDVKIILRTLPALWQQCLAARALKRRQAGASSAGVAKSVQLYRL